MRHRRLGDVAPDLADELRMLLIEAEWPDLAVRVDDLPIVDRCRCGDDFCATFYTAPRPAGAWGSGLYTIPLEARAGMLNLDVLDGKIVCVEVLYRDEVKTVIHAAIP